MTDSNIESYWFVVAVVVVAFVANNIGKIKAKTITMQ